MSSILKELNFYKRYYGKDFQLYFRKIRHNFLAMGFFEKILVESIFLDSNVWKENFATVMVILWTRENQIL